jgi:hypothetical protein
VEEAEVEEEEPVVEAVAEEDAAADAAAVEEEDLREMRDLQRKSLVRIFFRCKMLLL